MGQHFLNDQALADRIVSLGELQPGDAVWEIGPGKGILTEAILSHPVTLTAFELDRRMQKNLDKRFGTNLHLVMGDILKCDWASMLASIRPNQALKLISNIPYQITSPLLYRLEKHATSFSVIVLMVQKEFAQRLCAVPGTKDYGQTTLRLGLHFETAIRINVPAAKFDPPPNVNSSVIVMIPRREKPSIKYLDVFYALLNAVFMHRRKTLRNNLVSMIGKQKTQEAETLCPTDLNRRGETLGEKEFIALADLIGDLAWPACQPKPLSGTLPAQ